MITRRQFLKIIALVLTPGMVAAGLTLPLDSKPVYNVIVLGWSPFYVYPQVPATADHRSSDIYHIEVWRLDGANRIPYALPGDANETYKPALYTRGEDLPFEDGPTSGLDTWGKKFGDQWMLVGIFPGYVGVNPGTFLWTSTNQRTGKEWEILRIVQRGHIVCPPGETTCIGIDDELMPPNPPMNLAKK
jgi:hypothetical protein